MVDALISILPEDVVGRIESLMPVDINWMHVAGSTFIYQTKHYLTYGGGPEAGLCISSGSAAQAGNCGSATGARSPDTPGLKRGEWRGSGTATWNI